MRKLFKTRRDVVFLVVAIIWLITDITFEFIFYDKGICQIVNLVFIILFGIMTYISIKSDKFKNYLNKKI